MDSTPSTVYTLECELAVALAERNQADEKVNELEAKVVELEGWVEELRAKVREQADLEQWRQAHWEEMKAERQALREETKTLRAKLYAKTQ